MTNEKTNPMPYRAADAAAMPAAAGAAEAAGPDMAAPVITPDDVARGTELLRRYKDGKRALEARIIADEQWYRLRHWQYLRDRRREQGADVVNRRARGCSTPLSRSTPTRWTASRRR